MALPFPDRRFDAATMALVIFFVPDPAKSVAEMVRVVVSGGSVATYAWDMFGGGFPVEPIQAELRAMGVEYSLPPSSDASGWMPCWNYGRAQVSMRSEQNKSQLNEHSTILKTSGRPR